MKKTVTLEIAGARYRMTSDADEDHLRRLADLVNARVAALGPDAARRATPAQVLAMVALDIADDLVAREDTLDELRTRTADTVKDLIARIDERLQQEDRGTSSAELRDRDAPPAGDEAPERSTGG
ncbi:MAG TPA: cell division protein ZapA [Polyangiaceae bacterium LLY-WYZ-14_1]|nr:cell division protein ZapA [Polyangiaceae bacterium LLY-WYZ-14_1]